MKEVTRTSKTVFNQTLLKIPPFDLPAPNRTFALMAFRWEILKLTTSIKPLTRCQAMCGDVVHCCSINICYCWEKSWTNQPKTFVRNKCWLGKCVVRSAVADKSIWTG